MMPAPTLRPKPIDQALRYLALGLSIIPARARDKKPALPSWKVYQQRRPTESEVREWFSGHDNLNIAIITGAISRIVVVDADSAEAETWLALNHPSPIKSKTSKGAHYLYAHPGHEVRNGAKLGGRALDIRGDGGYIIAPGSIHPDGTLYREDGNWDDLENLPVFQVAWLSGIQPLVNPKDALDRRIRLYLERIPGATEGSRDNTGFRVACKLVREFALSPDSALKHLTEWNLRCTPPMKDDDLLRLIHSAEKSGRAAFGAKIEEPKTSWRPPTSVEEGGEGDLQELLVRTEKGSIKKTPGNLAKILRLDLQWGPKLQLDEMSRDVIYEDHIVGDTFIDWIQEQIEDHYGVAFGREDVAAKVLAQATERTIHPVREWLKSLQWDEKERISKLAYACLGSDSLAAMHYLRCTLVGAVRRVLHPGTKMDTLPVLEGDQGIGKSTFWRTLVGPHWFADSPIDLDSKDGMMVIHRSWCTEFSEIDHAVSTKAAERIKSFLSSSRDVFRAPFGKSVSVFPRSCFLVGTTNREGFLVDPTGSRRFWPIHCSKIDLMMLSEWRDQLWAEAVNMEALGVPHWLDQGQETLRESEASTYEAMDPWEEQIDLAVGSMRRAQHLLDGGISANDLLTEMGVAVHQQNRALVMRLTALLKKKGWTRKMCGLERVRRWFQ